MSRTSHFGSVSISMRHFIKLVQIWWPSNIRGRSGRLRSQGGGEDVMDDVSSLVSTDLPPSKVPRATVPRPDASLVMHQKTYATYSWIIKAAYAAVTLWAPSCVTLKVHRQARTLTHSVISWNCHLGILMQRSHACSQNSREAVVCTFLRRTGVSGIVPLLRRFIADRVAALGPPQHAEGSVQPLEGAAPHRRAVKVSDCGAGRRRGTL